MKFSKVFLESIGYELAPNVVTSRFIEYRLASLYEKLHLQKGLLEAWTGIRERRWWNVGHSNAQEAAKAAKKALEDSTVKPEEVGAIIYASVCRDNFEPATACEVAFEIGLSPDAEIFDLSNACLGFLNGIMDIANRIDLGHIKAGLVVGCETAREITDILIERMLEEKSMEFFKGAMATLTGGSGAAAVLLTDGSYGSDKPRLVGGTVKSSVGHHKMCWWGADKRNPPRAQQMMETDAVGLLKHGGQLVAKLGEKFYREIGWTVETVDKLICHQVASANRQAILQGLGLSEDKDFSTFEYLGNMGTVSLPITAALANERGFLEKGNHVALMGIGSGLNSLMLGWEW